jgi:hypothetical protein
MRHLVSCGSGGSGGRVAAQRRQEDGERGLLALGPLPAPHRLREEEVPQLLLLALVAEPDAPHPDLVSQHLLRPLCDTLVLLGCHRVSASTVGTTVGSRAHQSSSSASTSSCASLPLTPRHLPVGSSLLPRRPLCWLESKNSCSTPRDDQGRPAARSNHAPGSSARPPPPRRGARVVEAGRRPSPAAGPLILLDDDAHAACSMHCMQQKRARRAARLLITRRSMNH